jgi:hypothetical protein
MKCRNCLLSLKKCICAKVEKFFEAAEGVPRVQPSVNKVYAAFEIKGQTRIFRLPSRVRRVAS